MLRFEVKKVFSRPANKLALLILAVLVAVVSFLAVGRVDYIDENGNASTGIAAARNLRKAKNQWAGYVDAETLAKVIEENTAINASPEYLSKDYRENDKAYARKQGFSDILQMINKAFMPFQEYDYCRADSVSAEEAGRLYENRIRSLKDWLEGDEAKDEFSEEEKAFLILQYQKLETPLYYEYADGWKALLEYMPTIIMLTILILGFLVAGIFSSEFQLKADAVFFSAKLGRNRAVAAKTGAGFWIVTVIYWTVTLLYSAIVLAVLGTDGAGCAIQTSLGGWKSFYNITFGQEYVLTMLGGYLGSLFILAVSMFLSARSRSAVLAVTAPFILIFIPSFLSGIPVLSKVLGLFPDQLLQINQAVKYFNLYQIGKTMTGAVPVIMVLYTVLYFLLLPVTYRVYSKSEIK